MAKQKRGFEDLDCYIRYVRKQQQGQKLFGNHPLRETDVEYESTNPESTNSDHKEVT